MKLALTLALSAALSGTLPGPLQAEELKTPLTLALKREAGLATAVKGQAYLADDGWRRRVSQSRSGRPGNRAIIIGAVAGALGGFLIGSYLENGLCEWDCGPGKVTLGFTGLGAGGGAAIGWAIARW